MLKPLGGGGGGGEEEDCKEPGVGVGCMAWRCHRFAPPDGIRWRGQDDLDNICLIDSKNLWTFILKHFTISYCFTALRSCIPT